jgi:hypothetical protein
VLVVGVVVLVVVVVVFYILFFLLTDHIQLLNLTIFSELLVSLSKFHIRVLGH